jgi:hypothetical protein
MLQASNLIVAGVSRRFDVRGLPEPGMLGCGHATGLSLPGPQLVFDWG